MRRILIAAAFMALASPVVAAEPISGHAYVIDGDTLVVAGIHVRLAGIDAPELRQVCGGGNVKPWACGLAAKDALTVATYNTTVTCHPSGVDRYGRVIATCRTDRGDVAEWLVSLGYAEAYRKYSSAYVAAEARPRREHWGIWSSEHYVSPSQWRREHNR